MNKILPIEWIYKYSFVFISAFVLSLILVPLCIKILIKFKIMDYPNERKVHSRPVPRMGGIAIYFAFVLPLFVLLYLCETHCYQAVIGIIIGSTAALIIGIIDDIYQISALIKLIALFILTLLIWHFGIITSFPFRMFGTESLGLSDQLLNIVISMLWLTGITSAMNALDHMDALAGGVSVIASVAYFAVSMQTAQYGFGLLSLALIGSLLGFLVYNRHPAKVFMGDSGSFFLGFTLGAIGIMGGWSTNPFKAMIIPVAILSLPIFDIAFVIIYRMLNGTTKTLRESITYCGKDHIGHRLCDIGFTQITAVRIIYLISATVAISAITIRYAEYLEILFLLLQILMIYIIVMVLMQKGSERRL